jgi:hypothetical protein
MKADGAGVPDLILEQYALGELPEAEAARFEAALKADPALRSRLEELEASNEAILEESPPAEVAAVIRARMLSSPRPSRAEKGAFRPAPAFLFSAAAALLVIVATVLARGALFPSADDLTRAKGGAAAVFVYRNSGSQPVELRDGSAAATGDILQLKYSASGARYGAIYSIDGRGSLTRHLPAAPLPATRAPRLADRGAALDSAYELDDAPQFERFFIISSTEEFDLGPVAAALRDLASSGSAASADPRLPGSLQWKSLLLLKGTAQQ